MDQISNSYPSDHQLLMAVDCVLFGYHEGKLQLLIFKREVEPYAGQWSLVGSLIRANENPDNAAGRILTEISGLKNVFLEQLHCFGQVDRDPGGRVVSMAYWSLIPIKQVQEINIEHHHAKWVPLDEVPDLVLDHSNMVKMAIAKLREVVRYRPVGIELLADKFTLPQLLAIYESVYQRPIDDRNFRKKILASGLLIKLDEKDMSGSRRGAFLYQFDRSKYDELSQAGYLFEV